jgi:hypothetical protein
MGRSHVLYVRRSGVVAVVLAAALAACHAGTPPASDSPASPAPDFSGPAATPPPAWSLLTPTAMVTAPFSGVGNQFVFDVAAYGDGFVAVGEDLQFDGPVNSRIWTSPDGMTWTSLGMAANDLADAEVDLVATNGTRLVAVGGARAGDATGEGLARIIWVSDDAASWRRLSSGQPPFDGIFVSGVVGGPAGFIAWGADGTRAAIFHSEDGTAWTRTAPDPSFDGAEVRDIKSYRGGFVAIGAHRPTPPPGSPLMVGGPDTSTAAAWWSADGLSWQAADTDPGPGLGSLDVGASGLFALGGSGCGGCVGPGIVWRSDDGRHWRRIGSDVVASPAYASDGARIIRFDQQGSGDVSSSTDGSTWRTVANLGRVANHGFTVGRRGILFEESIAKGGPPDEVDGGMLFVAAQ